MKQNKVTFKTLTDIKRLYIRIYFIQPPHTRMMISVNCNDYDFTMRSCQSTNKDFSSFFIWENMPIFCLTYTQLVDGRLGCGFFSVMFSNWATLVIECWCLPWCLASFYFHTSIWVPPWSHETTHTCTLTHTLPHQDIEQVNVWEGMYATT